jgi:hypothetical protein
VEAVKSGARAPTIGATAEQPRFDITSTAIMLNTINCVIFCRFTILLLIWESGEIGQGIGKHQYPHYNEKYPTNNGNYIGPAPEPNDNRKRY